MNLDLQFDGDFFRIVLAKDQKNGDFGSSLIFSGNEENIIIKVEEFLRKNIYKDAQYNQARKYTEQFIFNKKLDKKNYNLK